MYMYIMELDYLTIILSIQYYRKVVVGNRMKLIIDNTAVLLY